LQGSCHGCPMSMMTLKNGIERIVREQVPGVTAVEAV
jgi:Fe-S cluster biogenesis protein NfuA